MQGPHMTGFIGSAEGCFHFSFTCDRVCYTLLQLMLRQAGLKGPFLMFLPPLCPPRPPPRPPRRPPRSLLLSCIDHDVHCSMWRGTEIVMLLISCLAGFVLHLSSCFRPILDLLDPQYLPCRLFPHHAKFL